ncbi:MAG TPA: aminotransferase [Porphyromonadaceae bacterium]|mgnify:CR=1 FL=1|nr:aminotransferase [Porphyromonadaceae bacterium]
MFPITKEQLEGAIKDLQIADITQATIRQICSLAANLEKIADDKFVHLEIGNPGLPASQVGIEAECKALRSGIPNKYPDISGILVLKEAGSKFIKAFLNVDIAPEDIFATVGSMQGSFALMLTLMHRLPGKDSILFLQPGFPATLTQAHILGIGIESFDIYEYRGKKMEAKLEEYLSKGNITALVYSNPNNPAWTNLTDEELEIIGRLATKYDVIVMEDLAYMGMDFRTDFSHPYEAPYIPTVAKYTDSYIMMCSASKIFSYAGQRIAIAAMSPKAAEREYPALKEFFGMPRLRDAFVFGTLYAISSGTAHSAQYALAAMLNGAAEGTLNFVETSREYGRRAAIAKKMLLDNGFHIVYDIDGNVPISDGFFFTAGYKDMTSEEMQLELMRYGISSISLPSTGSEQNGVRICVSMISDPETFEMFNSRLKKFNDEH